MGDAKVALRYAEALYALAREHGRVDGVFLTLVEVKRRLDESAELRATLMHPRMKASEKIAKIEGPLFREVDDLVINLVKLVIRKRREELFKDLFRVYLEVHERREGILRVRVESASPLADSAQEAIDRQLRETTGKEVLLETRTDPELLEGVRLVVGSHVIDGTLKGRLDRLQQKLGQITLN